MILSLELTNFVNLIGHGWKLGFSILNIYQFGDVTNLGCENPFGL